MKKPSTVNPFGSSPCVTPAKPRKTTGQPKETFPKLSPWAKEVKKRLEKLGRALGQE